MRPRGRDLDTFIPQHVSTSTIENFDAVVRALRRDSRFLVEKTPSRGFARSGERSSRLAIDCEAPRRIVDDAAENSVNNYFASSDDFAANRPAIGATCSRQSPFYNAFVRVLFLHVDGVLNRTGYHPGTSLGLRSWIEPELAARLTEVLRITGSQIVLSSDWRVDRELGQLQQELVAAGIDAALVGVTPTLQGAPRWRQIQAWMDENGVASHDVVIVDDGYDMGPLVTRFVRTSPLNGLDQTTADAVVALFADRGRRLAT